MNGPPASCLSYKSKISTLMFWHCSLDSTEDVSKVKNSADNG